MHTEKIARSTALSFGIAALVLGLTACSPASAPGGSPNDGSEPEIVVGPDTVLIDVRTPEEYAAGRLDGARLLDLNGGELAAAVPSLDPDAEYLVYCRSGNRSGQAAALMQQAGIPNVVHLGSLEEAARSTGLAILVD